MNTTPRRHCRRGCFIPKQIITSNDAVVLIRRVAQHPPSGDVAGPSRAGRAGAAAAADVIRALHRPPSCPDCGKSDSGKSGSELGTTTPAGPP